MAASPGKKGYTIRFELSFGGLLGVGVVCFCIFLWMFLLGLWAGQTGLISGIPFTSQSAISAAAKVELAKGRSPVPLVVTPEPEPEPAAAPLLSETVASDSPGALATSQTPEIQAAAPVEPEAKPPVSLAYTIQIGAFRDSHYVEKALQKWRAKGYEVFSRPPSGANEHLTKVYLGHFPEAEAARKEAASLAEKEKITPIIVAIPAEEGKRP